MVGITQPTPEEHVNAHGVWDLLRNKGKMTAFSLCLLLCADLLDLAVGKCDPPQQQDASFRGHNNVDFVRLYPRVEI